MSTRIILCVFVSTFLTAVIVSWLSINAIRRDVRVRVSAGIDQALEQRHAAITAWDTEASDPLRASSAIGSPWHRALIAAVDANPSAPVVDGSRLLWEANPPPPDQGTRPPALPEPPKPLLAHFDRIRLRSRTTTLAPPPGPKDATWSPCMSSEVDLVRNSGELVGTLEACLSQDRLLDLLHPIANYDRGLRLLVTDSRGRIVSGAGSRAEQRIGDLVPITMLLDSDEKQLPEYTDRFGSRLVGSTVRQGPSRWHLVAETEYSRAFAPAIAITNKMFVVDVCILLLFSVLAYKITTAIMKPIEALSEGAQRISDGQVNYEIPMPKHHDELGLLTRTFNDMMRALRSNQLELEEDKIRLAEKNEELQRANEILAQLSITDGLTKLHNHRYFQDHLTREIKRVSRTATPLSLILIDLDDFKLLNDTHGHAAGDEVLVSLAAIMTDSARESDLIARYGGEEFVILMPNTDLAGAVHLAEKIRMAVEATRLIIGESMKPIEVTISCGVAAFDGNRREFFAEADKALYQAKAAGKNCVIIAGSEANAED